MDGKRITFISICLLALFVTLVIRLYSIQVTSHEKYLAKAKKQQTDKSEIPAERGSIKDRNGVVLSYTSEDISISVDKRMLTKSEIKLISNKFSKVFNKDKNYYTTKIQSGSGNILLEKKVSKAHLSSIKQLNNDAIIIKNDFSRNYPYGSLASHVLGYLSHNGIGEVGIEKTFEKYLKGKAGLIKFEKDGKNRIVSIDEDLSIKSTPGADVYLTINNEYEKILEEELYNGLIKYKASSATGIIMNPKTGEILGMANLPNYDPANYNLFDDSARRNRAVTDTYEPGSTIKPIILSMLLNDDLINENEVVNTENGVYRYRSVLIRDTHKYSHLTVKEIIEHSSNIGMSKIIDRMKTPRLYKYLRDFGFGNLTSVDLTSEADGLLKRPERFGKLTKKFMSYGYQISVTPLQMIASFSAIVNGGILNQPHIVKKVVAKDGSILMEEQPKKIRRVLSKITSERIRSIMVGVVEEGTGTAARMDEMYVGGKTGTAQMLIDGNYSHQKYNSSFIGYFPAEDPQVIMYILYSAPQVGRYGGRVAAPVFKKIAERIVDIDISLSNRKKRIERKNELIKEFNIALKTKNNENKFSSFANVSNEKVTKRKFSQRTTMPNLKNYSLRNAIAQLSALGLNYKINGKTGRIVYQSIPVGKQINAGDVCIIKCENSEDKLGIRLN